MADSQKEAERLAEVEKKAVYNNAYFEMFGVFPRKFPMDVSFNFYQVLMILFTFLLINFLLIFRNVNLKPTRKNSDEDDDYGRPNTAASTAPSPTTIRRT